MKKRLALTFCLLLAGCSDADWNGALNYAGLGGDTDATADTAVEPAAPAAPGTQAQAVPNSDICRAVATEDATQNGFDPATQQRVFARSYSQCVTIYTH
jgi:hypothetical protein